MIKIKKKLSRAEFIKARDDEDYKNYCSWIDEVIEEQKKKITVDKEDNDKYKYDENYKSEYEINKLFKIDFDSKIKITWKYFKVDKVKMKEWKPLSEFSVSSEEYLFLYHYEDIKKYLKSKGVK